MNALFVIPLWADLLAVGIGAAQGALIAAQFRDRRLDLLGVAIIGIATGFGGGILRDLLLNQVPAALTSNWYLIVATAAALVGMLLERLISRLGPLITVLDALTIGLFAAIGTTKALSAGLPVVPAIFVGVLTAVGGSILRDVLLHRPIALMHVGSLYAVAAFAGTILLVVLLASGVPVFVAATICVALTFGIRVLAVLFNWTLPEQRAIEKLPRIRRRKPEDPRQNPPL
ncbi:MAG: trimeric intracellular cation channel family protein [Rhodoglobus sp.]